MQAARGYTLSAVSESSLKQPPDLHRLRLALEKLDRELLAQIKERMALSEAIAAAKRRIGLKGCRHQRPVPNHRAASATSEVSAIKMKSSHGPPRSASAAPAGIAASIIDIIQDELFDWLDAPVVRISQADVPMPYSKRLEQAAGEIAFQHVHDHLVTSAIDATHLAYVARELPVIDKARQRRLHQKARVPVRHVLGLVHGAAQGRRRHHETEAQRRQHGFRE